MSLKAILAGLLLCATGMGTAFAAAPAGMADTTVSDGRALDTAKGLIMLDYEVIPVPGNPSLDLLGFHYLHQVYPWLYLGLGLHGPLVYGDYGGFMAFDATVHLQHQLIGHSFIDAGASLGGGGGGASIQQSKQLSGRGGFVKGYAGLGYNFGAVSAGLNYAYVRFTKSLIHHAQLDFYIQKPVSFAVGSYADAGSIMEAGPAAQKTGENILTLELNNAFRIKPKGSNKKNIHLLSLQFSHFLTNNQYLFFGVGVGYKGLVLYNQALGGVGYRFAISRRVNLYSQIGVGSGGYAPTVTDTGPGLLVYPKLSIEYLLNDKLGLSLSGGYLFAPKGTYKNTTLGVGINYHLSADGNDVGELGYSRSLVFRGLRFHLFRQTEFDVRAGTRKLSNINMLSAQLDYIASDHWYIPFAVSAAYDAVLGYPGYGEVFTGLGIQNSFSSKDRFQGFFQILIGANALDVTIKPAVGFDYSLGDHLALYGQAGKAISLKKFQAYSIGLGLTYRFSIPDTPLQ